MTRAPSAGGDLAGVDLVLASHKHSDHLDPGTLPDLLAASPGRRLVVPEALVEHADGLGLPADRLVGLDAGETLERAGFRVRAIPSAHEGLDTDARAVIFIWGSWSRPRGCGCIIAATAWPTTAWPSRLGPEPFDVLFLPINGRDPARGCRGTCRRPRRSTWRRAVRPRFVVPHHYDMFTFNTVPVAEFEAEARRLPAGVEPRVLRCGERWEITP